MGITVFEEGLHYTNRRFGFTVIVIHGDRMLVTKDDGEQVVLSHNLQSLIQENIARQSTGVDTHYTQRSKRGKSLEERRRMSGWQEKSLAKFREHTDGGIVAECITC